MDVQGTRNVDAAASADVLLNFELPSDGSAAIFGACVLVGPITNATTGESLDPLPSQSVRREQEGELGLTDGVDTLSLTTILGSLAWLPRCEAVWPP